MRAPRVCDVEVDAGEVQNVSIGDTSRWLVHPAFSGGRETLTLHVMVKPSEHGIATNAIITTNRRTYYFGLVSKAKFRLGLCIASTAREEAISDRTACPSTRRCR